MLSSNSHNGHEDHMVIWFTPRVEREGELWTAYFDALSLSGLGSTEYEAVENLLRHVKAHCAALESRDLLARALQEAGITPEVKKEQVAVVI